MARLIKNLIPSQFQASQRVVVSQFPPLAIQQLVSRLALHFQKAPDL